MLARSVSPFRDFSLRQGWFCVYFVSGKSADSFSASGQPLYGKQAAAVTETSLHIKRTPLITYLKTLTGHVQR